MSVNSTNKASVLLVCSPGLGQASLYTTVNAIPNVTIIAKAAGAPSAVRLALELNPNVLLADANYLQDETMQLLRRIKELHLEMSCVVLTTVSSDRNRLLQEGADFVLKYSNLNQKFPQILSEIQVSNQININHQPPSVK